MIQSLPLASLRSDLFRLGIVRQAGNHDSEDHAGALCEIMALISEKQNNVPYETQSEFFERHIASWLTAFFKDLESAKSAGFYRMVGSLGGCFLESEREYLKCSAKYSSPHKRRLALDGLTFDVRPAEIYQGRGDRKRTCRFARPHQTGVSQRNKTAPAAGRIKQGLSINGTYKKILRDGEDVAGRQNIMEVCTHETIQ